MTEDPRPPEGAAFLLEVRSIEPPMLRDDRACASNSALLTFDEVDHRRKRIIRL
jgi:hypothetical protein